MNAALLTRRESAQAKLAQQQAQRDVLGYTGILAVVCATTGIIAMMLIPATL